MNNENHQKIATRLLEYGKVIDTKELFETEIPEATDLLKKSPYAFCIATCLMRQLKAETVWAIPYWIEQELGRLDPAILYSLSLEQLTSLVSRLPKKPRFVNDAPRTIQEITKIIVEQFDGDASLIWKGRTAAQVRKTFWTVHGVGPGIANMAVLLLEKGYGIRFSDLDHSRMDIKPDTHTMRVLYRLGVAAFEQEDEAISAARYLNPSYPGEIDGALWVIGRRWCSAHDPKCSDCWMRDICPKVEV